MGALGTRPMSESIAERLDGEPLLPLLLRLKLSADLTGTRCCSLLLLSPSIHDLDLRGDSGASFEESARILNVVVTSISSEVPSPSGMPGALPHVTRHLQTLTRSADLRKLHLHTNSIGIFYPTMQALSTLENLRELHCRVLFRDTDPHTPCRGDFTALESLHVSGSHADVDESIQMISSPRLHDLAFSISEHITARDLQGLFHNVRRAAAGLTALHIFSTGRCDATPETLSFAELLEPILSLRHMQQLKWPSHCSVNPACDRDMAAFAAAWPNLRVLYLPIAQHHLATQGVTFPALLDFSRCCPHLEHLHIYSLDVFHLPATDSIPRMEQSRVRHFSFLNRTSWQDMSPADISLLATLVDRLFPNVDDHVSKVSFLLAAQVFDALKKMRATSRGRTITDTS